MQNYRLKQKILKTKPVTYYRACHSNSGQPYVVKKLNRSMTWQQVLESKSMTLCKNTKCKYIARIKQIIKQQNFFYCIMQHSQANLTDLIKNTLPQSQIFKLAKQLVELMVGLYEENMLIRDIRPSHLFVGKNVVRLYHFETVTEKDLLQLDVTEQQDMRYTPPQQVLTKKGANQKSMLFTIGLIIAQVITGQPLINAKNKLQYIYQLTHLFPNQRMDKMKGSEHDFKELQLGKNQTFVEKMQLAGMGPALTELLGQMLKIDHAERIDIKVVGEALERAVDSEVVFHRNRLQAERENNLVNLPHKNQVNIEEETSYEIEFQFQNRPTLSSIPMIFNQKSSKGTALLQPERNVEEEGNQPIIIKQAKSPRRGKNHLQDHKVSKKSFSQKINMTPKPVEKLHVFSSTKPSSIPPINHPQSPSMILPYNSFHSNGLINAFKNNQILKNSRTSKQTTLHTVKRPQLTNYALNEVNPGLKVGLSNSLFSENHGDEQEYV